MPDAYEGPLIVRRLHTSGSLGFPITCVGWVHSLAYAPSKVTSAAIGFGDIPDAGASHIRGWRKIDAIKLGLGTVANVIQSIPDRSWVKVPWPTTYPIQESGDRTRFFLFDRPLSLWGMKFYEIITLGGGKYA